MQYVVADTFFLSNPCQNNGFYSSSAQSTSIFCSCPPGKAAFRVKKHSCLLVFIFQMKTNFDVTAYRIHGHVL
jgi:hypothetical protein